MMLLRNFGFLLVHAHAVVVIVVVVAVVADAVGVHPVGVAGAVAGRVVAVAVVVVAAAAVVSAGGVVGGGGTVGRRVLVVGRRLVGCGLLLLLHPFHLAELGTAVLEPHLHR